MTVTELLSDRARWTTRFTARDSSGRQVNSTSPEAVRWCAYGAMEKCYGTMPVEATIKFMNVLKSHGYVSIFQVNDTLGYDTIYPLIVEAGI